MIVRLYDNYSDTDPVSVYCSNTIISHAGDVIVLCFNDTDLENLKAIEANKILNDNGIETIFENNEIVINDLSSYEITILS